MKMRQRRKQFWWTWAWSKHLSMYNGLAFSYTIPGWGVGRIKHQHKDVTK